MNLFERISMSVLILGIIIFASMYFSALGDLSESKKDLTELQNKCGDLSDSIFVMKFKADRYDKFENSVSAIRTKGFSPDSLLIWQIEKFMIDKYPSLDREFIEQVAAKESSFGYNKRSGALDEQGWSQIREETLRYFVQMFGGDTTGFKMDHYKDVKTATEWSFALFYYAKMNRGKTEWKDWNNGVFMVPKQRKVKR